MADRNVPQDGANCNLTIVEHEGEPRVRDVVLGKKLGMARPRAIRQLIERHKDALAMFGPLATRCGASRGQEFTEYLLTEEQAVYIVTQSDAPNAMETKVQVVKVFVAWRHGHLSPTNEDSDLALRTNGIARSTIHKVTGIEKAMRLMMQAMTEQDSRINGLMLLADSRAAAVERVSVRQLLDEAGALPKGRNGINRRLGNALRNLALTRTPPVPLRRCIHSNVWLFPVDFANAFMMATGNTWVRSHNDKIKGQGTFKLVPKKPTEEEARP